MEHRIAFAPYELLFRRLNRFFNDLGQRKDSFYHDMPKIFLEDTICNLRRHMHKITNILRDCHDSLKKSSLPNILHNHEYTAKHSNDYFQMNKCGKNDIFLHMRFNYEYYCALNTRFNDRDIPMIDLAMYILFVRLTKIKNALIEKKCNIKNSYDEDVISSFKKMIEFYRETLIGFRRCHLHRNHPIQKYLSDELYEQLTTRIEHIKSRCVSRPVLMQNSYKRCDLRENSCKVQPRKSNAPHLPEKKIVQSCQDHIVTNKEFNENTSAGMKRTSMNSIPNLYHSTKQIEMLYVNIIISENNKLIIKNVLIYEVLTDAIKNGTHENFLTYDNGNVKFYFINMAILQDDQIKIINVLMTDTMCGTILVYMVQFNDNVPTIKRVMMFMDDLLKITNNTQENGPHYVELVTFENKKPRSIKILINGTYDRIKYVFRIKTNEKNNIERICLFNHDIDNIKELKYGTNIFFQQMLVKIDDNMILDDVLIDQTMI